ncbi:hypothetical protein [Lysinibacillus odysseyi]|uniref:hypothetical protein n=1 Tax=Lysinibacillus odysseyi TaxID=202611 RepID=UPI0006900B12|nr:hypothetical protein [Lysinibacillus odysseyi]
MAGNNNEINITFKAFNQDFNKSIKEMNAEAATLKQQMKLQQEQMKHTASETQQLEAKMNSLQQIYEVARRKTQATADAISRAKQLWGENSEEVKKLEAQLTRHQIAEQQAANAITATQQALQRAQQAQADQAASLRQLNNLFTVTGQSVSDFSNVLGQDLTRAIQNGTASASQLDRAFNQIAQATQGASANVNQVRQALAQLDAGASVQSVQNSLRSLNTVTRTAADQTRDLQQAMRLQQEEMKHTASETQQLEAKVNSLQAIHNSMQRETQETTQQLLAARAAYGANSREAQQLEAQLQRNRLAQQQTANAITETNAALARARQEEQQVAGAMQDLNRIFALSGRTLTDFTDVLGNDLTRAIQEGRASSAQLDQALERIGRSVVGTEVDVNELRQALQNLGSSGNLDTLRRDLEDLSQGADDARDAVENLGSELAGLAAGAAAGVGLGKVIEESLSASDTKAKINVVFDVPESSKASIRAAIADVTAYGVEGEDALEGLRRQWALNKNASDEANRAIVTGAAVITKSYQGIDFVELVQETNEVSKALKISDKAALDLINSLLKVGFPPEQLDIIAEYGTQLQRAGFQAKEIKGIMAAAAAADSFNIDNLLDGLKEGRIRAAEMGVGLSNSMKDAVKSVVDNTKAATDEQLAAMSSTFAKQEDALSKSLERRYNAISKSYDNQKKALDKALDNEYRAAEKSYEKQETAKEKSLEKQYEEAEKMYAKQLDELENSLEAELEAYEKAADAKIALIDKEYNERLKLIDEERYRKVKAIEDEIAQINATQAAEDKRRKERENAEKRSELQAKIRTAKNAKDRQDATKALRDFEESLRIEKVKEERQAQIESLRTQKDSIKEAFDEQKDALKSEYDEKKEQTKEQLDADKKAMKERQDAEKASLKASNQERLKLLKEANTAEINAYKETNRAKLESLREEHATRKEALSERLNAELSAVRESHQAELSSFREMNQQKLDLAKNPPDSAAYKAIEGQLESWGKAIAKGGDEGAKAFEDMTRWLNGLEDATLKNAIGTELFGTMWEDQGQNIIDSILNADGALQELNKSQKSLNKDMDDIDESAMVKLQQAVSDLKVALDPLLNVIADVIGAIAEWMSKNPELASAIVAIGSAIGIFMGLLAGLAPIVTAVASVIGLGGGGLGLSGVLANLASKVLPLLMRAFSALTGPIGIAIAVLTTVVPLIIKHWDSIAGFFQKLWDTVIGIFKSVGGAIVSFLKENWATILAVITGPIGILVKAIVDNWSTIKNKTVEIFTATSKFFSDIWSKILEIAKTVVSKIKGFFSFSDMLATVKEKWNGIYSAIKGPIEKARDAVKSAIDKIKSFFKFEFDWPKLKVPKFSIKGSINPLDWFDEGLPKIDIKWFAKGGIMTGPTVFGATGNSLLAGGEAGPEAILPLNERVLGTIGNAMFKASGGQQEPQVIQHNYARMLEGAVFHLREEADIKKVAREFYTLQQKNRKGK